MLSTFIKALVDDQSGASAVEYGLIIALIVLAMIGALQGVATSTAEVWGRVQSEGGSAMSN
jgi:pilus assembly protein Flp/PilA